MQKIEQIENAMDGKRFREGSERALWKEECKRWSSKQVRDQRKGLTPGSHTLASYWAIHQKQKNQTRQYQQCTRV